MDETVRLAGLSVLVSHHVRGGLRADLSLEPKFLGELDRIGTVATGKQADLVAFDGNLAANIGAIRRVKLVFKDGAGYDPAKLLDSVKGSVGLH